MCPACQNQACCLRAVLPHPGQFCEASESQHVGGFGQIVVDFFSCGLCGTRMQRDRAGLGQRQRWRTVSHGQAIAQDSLEKLQLQAIVRSVEPVDRVAQMLPAAGSLRARERDCGERPSGS